MPIKILKGQVLTDDILSEILNKIWTGREPRLSYQSPFRLSDPSKRWTEEQYRNHPKVILWDSLCYLSRTCSTLRNLCLPRMYGTLVLGSCKMIGQLWKSLQANPSLGSYTHTCCVKFEPRLWPHPFIPSEAIERMFTFRDMLPIIDELKISKPGRLSWEEERRLMDYSLMGPDGGRFDANIKNTTEFKQALETIFFSFTDLKRLEWQSRLVSVYSSIISHLEKLESLEALEVSLAACEEDHLLGSNQVSSARLPDPTPIWKLSSTITTLKFGYLGQLCRDMTDMEAEWHMESGPILDRQCQAFIKSIELGKNLKSLDLNGLDYLGEQGQRPYVLASILPTLACVPVEAKKSNKHYRQSIQVFHPQIKRLAERNHVLTGELIRHFGKECSEMKDHPLTPLVDLLLEEETSEEIAKEWNRRFVAD